jgi:LmbE family N-acetylglucosaminyl deacetylase
MDDGWQTPQKILVILAHPDDPEFFCGATIARWTAAGHKVVYWLLTCGDKGANDLDINPGELCGDRRGEQTAAAAVLGVRDVNFLDCPDGYLVADLEMRKILTRIIRKERPDILVTCDPKTLYVGDNRINHPDHRAAGQAALDAVFPAAGNPLYFPELIRDEGLQPHTPKEVWISLTLDPNIKLDVTDLWQTKLQALYEHRSQIGDREAFTERMLKRHTPDSTIENPRYEEVFRRIVFA